MSIEHTLTGRSLVAGEAVAGTGEVLRGYNPVNGLALEPEYRSACPAEVDRAVAAAVTAFNFLAACSGADRARLLRAIADGLDASAEPLIVRAMAETALPRPRLTGEVARTSGQLRLFAAIAEEGSWVNARIDTADPARTPPKPDVRSMLRPLGPVAVFGSSNFPLAFSVAGGDTASALAAGNPVVVKAHPAHPGTSELAGRIVTDAVEATGFPAGTFSLLFDAGLETGTLLVKHPGVKAVGFTGSFRGGRALMDLAQARPEPIPVYAEMGSTNPVFILPGALRERGESLASGLHGSFTLGAGQFCTKPGLIFAEEAHSGSFAELLRGHVQGSPAFSLLTKGIAEAYSKALAGRQDLATSQGAPLGEGFSAQGMLLEVDASALESKPELAEEVFGPTTLLVHCETKERMLDAARGLHGHLTATVLGTEADLQDYAELLQVLERKVGRLIFNAFPTGVEVNHSMVHGGPYPATSDGRSTSVGGLAILRFARPVAYQGMPQSALPEELRDGNPLGIRRILDGKFEAAATTASLQDWAG